jgi:2,5-diketo-D-gluconate reductase A
MESGVRPLERAVTANNQPLVTLNSGKMMPQLGLGAYKVNQDIAVQLVQHALEIGYRRIDTAALYDNEAEVGAAIRKSGLSREEVFVTSKIWNDRHGYAEAKEAIQESVDRLNIDYVDMMLIHWPCPKQDKFVETWRAFEEVLETGVVRSIGVSNFNQPHLEKLLASANVIPAINQVELHPQLAQNSLRHFNSLHGIKTEAWAPLGRARFNDNILLGEIAESLGKTVAQVIIRWHLQLGNLVIPKSSNPDRLAKNFDVFDFELNEHNMGVIATLNTETRIATNPDDMN